MSGLASVSSSVMPIIFHKLRHSSRPNLTRQPNFAPRDTTPSPSRRAGRSLWRGGGAAVRSYRADLGFGAHLSPPSRKNTGAVAISQPHGRRGRLYVRRFLRVGSTEPLLPPKTTMEMGVHRVHGRSDRDTGYDAPSTASCCTPRLAGHRRCWAACCHPASRPACR